MNDEAKKETTHGLIRGRGNGDWGRITALTDGSILLENVALSNISIRNCDLHAESGEYTTNGKILLKSFAGRGLGKAAKTKIGGREP